MEYQKIKSSLDNTSNQLRKLRIKSLVEIDDETHRTYATNSQIKCKTLMLKSSSLNYRDAYIHWIITVPNIGTTANSNNRKNMTIKNGALFTGCIIEINNRQIGDAKDIDIVMTMYNLI